MESKLSNKQRAFVNEYLIDFNATQAAIRAGYSPKTAYSIGWENLRKPEIEKAIQELVMGREEVLLRLTDIARGDIADLMDITSMGFTLDLTTEDGSVNPKTKLIKKIKQKVTTFLAKKESEEDREVVETEIELYSAHEALRDLGKHHGLFIDRTDITTKGEAINRPDPNFDRAISTLFDAIGKIVHREDSQPQGDLGSAEHPTMAGVPVEGG